jgi:hypothetical protein
MRHSRTVQKMLSVALLAAVDAAVAAAEAIAKSAMHASTLSVNCSAVPRTGRDAPRA